MSVRHMKEVAARPVIAGVLTTMQVLISAQDGSHFAMRRFVMAPGGAMPNHTNTVEHEQYVLGGHALIGIGDKEFMVESGAVVFIPQGVPHWYKNIGDDNFEFLCMIPNGEDEITLLDEKNC
jgi:quercetin dioxygenase-like cupin family protein